jgi:hypothetical protein
MRMAAQTPNLEQKCQPCVAADFNQLLQALDGTGVTANCFHPGLVATGFNRNNGLLMDLGMTILKPVERSPEKGAETLVWLVTSPTVANVSGVLGAKR